MGDRCPRCGGALKPGAQWCGLCYADLRPAPPPPPVPAPEPVRSPEPSQPPAIFAPMAAVDAPTPVVGDGTAPTSGLAEAVTTTRKGWPCLECGAVNPFELEACASCGMPFGAALRTPAPTLPGDRRTRIGVAVAVAALLMGLIALLSVATGGDPPAEPDTPAEITVDG